MPAFYSPQLTPSTPSAPSISYGYPTSPPSRTISNGQAQGQPHFNLGPTRNYASGSGPMRMAQSGASTPVPTSPVQGPVPRSSSMMDFGSYGQSQGQSAGQALGQVGRWNAAAGGGGGFGFGMGMGMTAGASGNSQGGGSSPIDLQRKGTQPTPPTSIHPSSFDPSPAQLGIGSSSSAGSADDPGGMTGIGTNTGDLAMSISPPTWGSWGHYQPAAGSGSYGASLGGNGYMGSWGGMGAGSFVGSLGQMGQSFGRERDRELEARYVKDFSCCGRQLNGLHELLEHYEEEHANLSPDARFAALSAAQAPPGYPRQSFTMPNPSVSSVQPSPVRGMRSPGKYDDAPAPPGMMDIEMDDDASAGSNTSSRPGINGGMGYVPGGVGGGFGGGGFGIQPSAVQQHSPWASAFKPIYPGTTGIPPSLLTMPAAGSSMGAQQGQGQQATLQNPQVLQHQLHQIQLLQQQSGSSSTQSPQAFSRPITPLPNGGAGYRSLPASQAPSRASTPLPHAGGTTTTVKQPLSAEELEARAARKAQRKADRQAQAKRAAENGEDGASGEEGGGTGEVEKKFPCPIEGCGKVYKQANGLKYHLTRSINSGHGNVAEMGLPPGALDGGKMPG